MKSFSVAALALSLASCAQNPGALTLAFSTIDVGCGSSDPGENYQPYGTLDIANGQAPNRVEYWVQVNLELHSNLKGLSTQTGQVLEPADRDQFVLDHLHLTYVVRKGNGIPKTLPVTDDVKATAVTKGNGKVFLPANIIGPRGSEALFDEIDQATGPVTAADIAQLSVGVEAVGRLAGSGVSVTSGKVEFPLEIYMSNGCPNGYADVLFSCPFPGQDKTKPVCK